MVNPAQHPYYSIVASFLFSVP